MIGIFACLWCLVGIITLTLEMMDAPELPAIVKVLATVFYVVLGPLASPIVRIVLRLLEVGNS